MPWMNPANADCALAHLPGQRKYAMAQIRRGPSGIKLLLQYLRKINWQTDDILLTVATLKLTQLLEEM
jgi:hypothetical protein